MNRLALIGAGIAVLVCAAVAFAADPSPSPAASPGTSAKASAAATANPSMMPASSTAPSSKTSPSATSGSAAGNSATASPQTWTGDVNPVNIQGTATVTKNSDGTATLVLKLTGMVNEQNWTVDVEPGYIQHPNDSNTIAFKQGEDVSRIAPDTIQVTLSKTETQDFERALSSNPGGVTIFVSDGQRLSAANIPANAQ